MVYLSVMIVSVYAVDESFCLYYDGERYEDVTNEWGCSSVGLNYYVNV